jgi:hypothetical protein
LVSNTNINDDDDDDDGNEGDGDGSNGNNRNNTMQSKLFFPYDSLKSFPPKHARS